MLLRLPPNASQNPPLLPTPPFRKLQPCARLTSTSATTIEQRTHLYSTVVSQPSTSCHKTQADKEFVVQNFCDTQSSNPSPAPKSPSSAPSRVVPDTTNPNTPQSPQDTHTNAFYIHFDPKTWKDETTVLVALNSEFPLFNL